MLFRIRIFLSTLICITSLVLQAQDVNSLSSTDLSRVDIDALNDDQIQQFLDRAEGSGLTLDQLEILAKQRGMSASQVAKLRNRIRQLELGGQDADVLAVDPSNRLREDIEEEDEYPFFDFLVEPDSLESDELAIFGLDIFRTSNLTFEPSLNVATPENYVLGPGDEIIVDVYGASEITYQQFVTPDGSILVSGIGPIGIAGVTLSQARTRIFNRLSSIYSGLKGSNPSTFLQVSVGQVRSIKVNVVGNVLQPGTYTISSFASAFNALYFAGGPTESGSMRGIEVIRQGKKIAVLDVYKYLFEGDNSQNPQLQDQDILVVKPYLNRVKFAGNVKQPAVYEMKSQESFKDLLKISGGFSEGAFKKSVTIDRVGSQQKEVSTIFEDSYGNEMLQNGDSIYISKVLQKYTNRVKIEGAVQRPGYYELSDDLTLSGLIELASGLREDAHLGRGNIIRLKDNLTLTNLSFDLGEVQNGAQDLVLSPEDLIRVPSIFDLEENKTLTIQGQVKNPGEFPFINGMTVEDLVNLSGGLRSNASTATVEVARKLLDNSDLSKSSEIFTFSIAEDLGLSEDASSFVLKPFDLVLVKTSPFKQTQKVIKIEGEVLYPGFYALETNEDKISDVLKRAGGLTQYGYANGASLIRRSEYYRTEYEKEELEALLKTRRTELERRYAQDNSGEQISKVELIDRDLEEYERELTENIKIRESSDQLEARFYRAQQLRKLQQRDSIAGANELVELESIGIELNQIIQNPNTPYDLILRDGDLISIPRQLETVKVQGEVLYPNTVRFESAAGFKQYISAAGGVSENAKPGKAYIVYANGVAKRTKKVLWFKNYPPVLPGADIIVPKKAFKQKVDARDIIALTSAVATMLLVVDRLGN